MGAEVDKTEKSFFIFDKPELNPGAVASGMPNYRDGLSLNLTQPVAALAASTALRMSLRLPVGISAITRPVASCAAWL